MKVASTISGRSGARLDRSSAWTDRADLVRRKGTAAVAEAGADDPATPPWQLERIATAVADGKLLVVPGAAHLASAERPDLVTPAVVAHLLGDGS